MTGYRLLQLGLALFPLSTGADKFLHVLVNWNQYVCAPLARLAGQQLGALMKIAGAFELLIGVGLLLRPRIFGFVLSGYLLLVVLNLLLTGAFFDIALRDFSIGVCALALGRLSGGKKVGPAFRLSNL